MQKKKLANLFKYSSVWFVALFAGGLFEPSFQFKLLATMISLLGVMNCYALSVMLSED